MSHPVRYGTYRRKDNGVEYRFIGYVEQLAEGDNDLCLMAPSVSGFDLSAQSLKQSEDHTIYAVVRQSRFDEAFEETQP